MNQVSIYLVHYWSRNANFVFAVSLMDFFFLLAVLVREDVRDDRRVFVVDEGADRTPSFVRRSREEQQPARAGAQRPQDREHRGLEPGGARLRGASPLAPLKVVQQGRHLLEFIIRFWRY